MKPESLAENKYVKEKLLMIGSICSLDFPVSLLLSACTVGKAQTQMVWFDSHTRAQTQTCAHTLFPTPTMLLITQWRLPGLPPSPIHSPNPPPTFSPLPPPSLFALINCAKCQQLAARVWGD